MKKRLLTLLLILCLTVSLLPNAAFAASGNVYTFDDDEDASYQNGAVVWKSSERTLYLTNATIATEQNGIYFECYGDVTIVLQGTNSITVNNNTTSGVVWALNTWSEKLTIKGTEKDGYMGTLTLETKQSKGDNAVIYNFDHLTVENVAHLNVIAGNCGSSKSSYGLWSLAKHHNLQFTNTCVEISVKEAGNYGYAINNYDGNTKDRDMDIKFNNSSLKIISKSGRVVRDRRWDGDVYVNGTNVGNPQTGTDGYTSTSSGKIVYHYTDSNGVKKTSTQTETIPSSGQTTKVNYTLPQRNGYTFKGWNTKEDGTGTKLTGTSKDVYYYQNGEAVDWNLLQRTNNELHLYEVWEPIQYTVIYTDGSGSEAYFEDQKTENLAYNADTPAFVGQPTRPGYTFKEWSPAVAAKVTKNAIYTATWTQDEYKVTYDVNGGTGTVTDSNSYTYGNNVDVKFAPVPQKQGCTFAGWNTKQDGTGTSYTAEGTKSFQITGNTTLYAQWETDKYTVIYTDGSGSEAYFEDQKTENLAYDADTPAFNGTPTRPGYTFKEWSPAVDAKVTKNATYTATWTQDKYKVTYDVNGGTGTVTDTNSYTYGNNVNVKFDTVPQKQGCTFAGWNTKQDGTGTSYTAEGTKSFLITGNTTLYAQWKTDKYTVIYDVNGGTGTVTDSNSYTYGNNVDVKFAPVPQKQGCTFAGWNTKQDGTGTSYTAEGTKSFQITGNTTLYAQWESDKYTVIYDVNGGTGTVTDTNSYTYGDNVNVKFGTVPQKQGSTFAGWNTRQDGTGTSYTADGTKSFQITANTTLYAQWETDKYTVIYTDGSGSEAYFEDQKTENLAYNDDTPAFNGTPTRPGYTFKEWSPAVDAKVTKNATYTATWTQDKYKVTYDVNGGTGTVTDTNSYTYGDNVNVKFDTVPQKQGCTFAGWNTRQDGTGTSYTADGTKSFQITANTTLYAQWKTDKYSVIYTDGSGSEAYFEDQKTENLAYNADTPAFNGTPTRPGYTFKEWSPAVDAKVTKNTTYTATWTQDKYKVTYDVNGGTGTVTDSNSYTYGNNVNVKFDTVPQKQGCTFAGWNTRQDGTGTSYTAEGTKSFQITGNTTLYAQWEKIVPPTEQPPKTGDTSHIELWLSLAALSLLGVAMLMLVQKRSHSRQGK